MDLHSPAVARVNADDERWEAFERRDPSADGQFVVAVESTCIYCRPICPARRPLRKNVEFLAAHRAADCGRGYRACKRCKPDQALAPARPTSWRVRRLLLASLDAPPGLEALAKATGLTPSHLQRTFHQAHRDVARGSWRGASPSAGSPGCAPAAR
jgi:AraC family transcriptional regulator of adaptative response/methylated-DNA-[protein]-cysteine methyltransferase